MNGSVTIKDNKIPEVTKLLEEKIGRALEKCGLIGESYTKLLTPVATGNLRNSISHQVEGHTVYIGTAVEYGKYVELGTVHQTAQPFLQPAIEGHMGEYRAIIQDELKD